MHQLQAIQYFNSEDELSNEEKEEYADLLVANYACVSKRDPAHPGIAVTFRCDKDWKCEVKSHLKAFSLLWLYGNWSYISAPFMLDVNVGNILLKPEVCTYVFFFLFVLRRAPCSMEKASVWDNRLIW